jgi:hypothetical protein
MKQINVFKAGVGAGLCLVIGVLGGYVWGKAQPGRPIVVEYKLIEREQPLCFPTVVSFGGMSFLACDEVIFPQHRVEQTLPARKTMDL